MPTATTFEGYAAGYLPDGGVTTGEFVFNTSLSGYQEVITDPSYAGQIISFTYPHIGNYGVTPLDDEAARPWCEGIVVRELSELSLQLAIETSPSRRSFSASTFP